MEDPMDENKDDNLGSMVEIGRKKNKITIRKPKGRSGFCGQKKKKFEQIRKTRKWCIHATSYKR